MIAKRIFFLPWGGMETASSRLRVYSALPHLKNAKIGTPKSYKKGDVLIIQKTINPQELQKAQSEGAKVIYDIDDMYLDRPEFAEMCRRADLVTVGSFYYHRWFPDAPVIDDALDWDGTKKEDLPPKPEMGEKKYDRMVGWHGYGNLNYLQSFAHAFTNKGYIVRAIVADRYRHYYEQYDVKSWSLETIDKDLAECDLCAFYLPEDDFSKSKGMNKLIKAWAIGLPCFVSYTQEYDRCMQEAGVRGFIVPDDQWETFDFTKPWEPKMREYALQFTGERTAKQWLDAIKLL